MPLSLNTLKLLQELLESATVSVGGENFEDNVPKLVSAKKELREEIEKLEK